MTSSPFRNDKNRSYKVYLPNFLSIPQNGQLFVDEAWKQQEEQNQFVQEKKQIDKILHSVVKQRMFGDILLKKAKDPDSDLYHTLDNITKWDMYSAASQNKIKKLKDGPTSSSRSYLQNSTIILNEDIAIDFKNKKFQLDLKKSERSTRAHNKNSLNTKILHSSRQTKSVTKNYEPPISLPKISHNKGIDLEKQNILGRKVSFVSNSPRNKGDDDKNKKGLPLVYTILGSTSELVPENKKGLEKFKNLPDIFRHLCDNSTTQIIYDVKIAKTKFLKKISLNSRIPQKILQKFLNYFSLSGTTITYKQYINLLELIDQTSKASITFINFIIYQILDESRNSFLTISDLFRVMQNFLHNSRIQAQIFSIKQKIAEITLQLSKKSMKQRYIKPTTQQMLVTNHNITAHELKQLLQKQQKQSNNLKTAFPKRSSYHQSIMILEHDAKIRLKNGQIQQSHHQQQLNKSTRSPSNIQNKRFDFPDENTKETDIEKGSLLQEGMRFEQFNQMYKHKFPEIFNVIVQSLLNHKLDNK